MSLNIDQIVKEAVEKAIQKALCNKTTGGSTNNKVPVIVCTDKRGVFFGYTPDISARPIVLENSRMCLYWDSKVGGVLGLSDVGPSKDCKISATSPSIILEGVTAIFSVSKKAEDAWVSAKVQGRN